MLFIFYGVYITIVLVASLVLKAVRSTYTGAGVLSGALTASIVSFSILFGAVLLYESDESYWYYGPRWRSDVLIVGTAVLFLATLTFGPVIGGRVGRRFSNRGR